MKSLFKIVIGLLLLLVVLVVAAVVVIPMVVDPNDFKPQISEQVKKATGRDLTIDGEIGLSVFPWLGFELGHTTLSNHAKFGDEPMLEIGQAGVRVKLLPLLQRELVVDQLRLGGAVVRVGRLADGTSNWDDLTGVTEAEPEEPADESESSGPGLAGLAIGGLNVTSAQLIWDDAQAGSRYVLEEFNLLSGEMSLDRPIDLKLDFKLQSSEPKVAGTTELSARLTFSPDQSHYLVEQLVVEAALTGDSLPGGGLALRLQSDIEVDLAADTAKLSGFEISLYDIELSGDAAVTSLQSAPALQGQFRLAELNPQALLKRLGQPAVETSDAAVLKKLAAEFGLSASAERAALSELHLTLDDTSLNGALAISNFAAPAINFDLALDAIDLDRYLLPASEAEADATTSAGTSAESGGSESVDLVAAVAPLTTLNLEGNLKAGAVTISGLQLSDLVVGIKARDSVAVLSPLTAKLYGGGLDGSITVNARSNRPAISIRQQLSGVQIGPLVKDLADNEQVSGVANIDLDLAGAGQTSDDLLADLDGNLNFSVVDGQLKGINIDRDICRARGALKTLQGNVAEVCDPSPDSVFSQMRGSAVVTNGVVKNRDLLIQQLRAEGKGYLQITGAGEVNLPNQTVDYRLQAARAREVSDAAGVTSLQTKGQVIPVRVTGSLASPSIKPDVAGVVKEKVKAKLFEKLTEQFGGGQSTATDSDAGAETESQPEPLEPKEQLKQQLLKGLFGG